ncbi:MAG: hypothetical protein GWN84_05675 [Gammaproteobacteria bacterium]|nr:hypothetical protein [Gammaproteobacteria bacterium]NIR82467.1 hypothetical protein [Gammaproteobacteria bacterium]NIR88463.1 hypothetical protein [Gammaproteobacteria bacterium]NIU03603.1 hypothetical protein [Gammaproteobacteria bacterium]NIV50955.1 hypothetical protein [Gammaproteobacteria bacterium]
MAEANTRGPCLGIIWPDDGRAGPDYEMLRLEAWLVREGLDEGLQVAIGFSRAARFHTHADLHVTGSLEALLPVARDLARRGSGVLVWACTSGSFIGGLEWARRQAQALADAAGVPASSTTLAIIEAARGLGAERLDVLGAYPEPVTRALAECLEEAGFAIGAVGWLDAPEGTASFGLDIVAEVRGFAAGIASSTGSTHPIVIPDTAINTLARLSELEAAAGRPVITANWATLNQGLEMLGLPGLASRRRAELR